VYLIFPLLLLQAKTRTGYTFSTPYLVTGLTFAGESEFVDCMSPNINGTMATMDDVCQDTKVSFVISRNVSNQVASLTGSRLSSLNP